MSADPFEERLLFDEIVAALLYAIKAAASSDCNTEFLIDSTHYELNIDTNCLAGGSPSYTTPVFFPTGEPVQYANFEFPPSISNVTAQRINFYPQGWACQSNGNTQSTLQIQIMGAQTRTIQVICSTGFIGAA